MIFYRKKAFKLISLILFLIAFFCSFNKNSFSDDDFYLDEGTESSENLDNYYEYNDIEKVNSNTNQYVEEELFNNDSNLDERINNFDISKVKLKMKPEMVQKILKKNGYILKDSSWKIPEFFEYNYDKECRDRNFYLTEDIKFCIDSIAKQNNMKYIDMLKFEHSKTKETLVVNFTSNILKNLSYKVEYKNNLDVLKGLTKNFKYQQEEDRRTFWYNVLKKYRKPNFQNNIWIYDPSNENSTTLIAGYDGLLLENKDIRNQDFIETLKVARQKFKSSDFKF